MAIVFVVTLTNENLISCNQGDPRKRDQALHVNKDHFKIAVGLTEEKLERFTANILKINFSLISSVLIYLNLRHMLLKEKFERLSAIN